MGHLVISDDGLRSEQLPRRRNTAKLPPAPDTIHRDRLFAIAETWDTTSEDMARIGPRGLVGAVSPAVAKRVGATAQRMGAGCAWTVIDCVLILRVSNRMGEADESVVEYDTIGQWLGISGSLAEKYHRIGKRFPSDERHPGLDVTHHEEVCSLATGPAEEILAEAEASHLSASAVRELVRAKRVSDPEATRNGTGRKPREAQLPTGPPASEQTPSVPVVPAGNPLPGTVTATELAEPRGDEYAPAGKPPPPSVLAQAGRMICLSDRELSSVLLDLRGHDVPAAEELLAEIVREWIAARG